MQGFDLALNAYGTAARTCDAKDDLGRFRYIEAQKVVEAVKRHLEAVIVSGVMPDTKQDFEQKKSIFPKF